MRASLQSWLPVIVAVLGGICLGLGVGRMAIGFTVAAAVWALAGVILLWWAIAAARKANPRTGESEADGSHTIE